MSEPKIIFIDEGKEVDIIDFGVVPVSRTVTKNLIVKNVGDVIVRDIIFRVEHLDVKIVKAPKQLGVKQERKLILEYRPLTQTESGLKTKMEIRSTYWV